MIMKEWTALCDHISGYGKAALSFSGGVDSTVLLAAAARTLPDDHIAIFVNVPMLSERQRTVAKNITEELGVDTVTVKLEWEDMPGVRENTHERCYFCKRAIYSAVGRVSSDNGYDIFIDGENSYDRTYERPGRRAAAEFGIRSPLKELNIDRETVRKMFRSLDLSTDVQKETCMATRVRDGIAFNTDDLKLIEECEDLIRKISGVRQIRMRMRDDHVDLVTSSGSVGMLLSKEKELTHFLTKKGISDVRVDMNGYYE
ncbi:MAG: hypothetical protein LBE48_00365 [Methanomassiliicoccaceae archaeon]|jgi:uncharacterized protein|nr:hypothetical protein [Methanomassiliicoccaceae archaeon]